MRPSRGLIGPLLTCLGIMAFLVSRRRLDVVEVRGRSMAPTLVPGDRLLAVRIGSAPRVGDIVLAPDPREPSRELVKRVTALEATGLRLRGDNPAFSTDERVFGAISPDRVRWLALARLWPMRRIGPLGPAPSREFVDEGGEPACAVPESLIAGSDTSVRS